MDADSVVDSGIFADTGIVTGIVTSIVAKTKRLSTPNFLASGARPPMRQRTQRVDRFARHTNP
jgi:hypothetical protein